MVYQVGSPAMFDGNMFLPDTGTPIWKIDRSSTMLAVWLPDPLTVATWMAKSLTMRSVRDLVGVSCSATSVTGIFLPCSVGSFPEPGGGDGNQLQSEDLRVAKPVN